MGNRLGRIALTFLFSSIFYCYYLYADMTMELRERFSDPWTLEVTPVISNKTYNPIRMGGWRFKVPKGKEWPKNCISYANIDNKNWPDGRILQIFYKKRANDLTQNPDVIPPAVNNSTTNFAIIYPGFGQQDYVKPQELEILFKLGVSGGLDPHGFKNEPPITVAQIDSLIKLPNYYSVAYRYIDTLGTRGDVLSGGFIDTYLGQTQAQFALPPEEWDTWGGPGKMDTAGTKGPLYWMGVSGAQEYFGVDMQILVAIGIQETGATIYKKDEIPPFPYEMNNGITETNGGPFQVELPTYCSRAIAYNNLFPAYQSAFVTAKHPDKLAAGTKDTWWTTYIGQNGTRAEINAAGMINWAVASGLVLWFAYDIFYYSTDLCWKQFCRDAKDRYFCPSLLAAVYNKGIYIPNSIAMLKNLSLIPNPQLHTLIPDGQDYYPNINTNLEHIVGASKKAQTDQSIAIYDAWISKTDLQRFFFGDGGSAAAQGKGGLVLYYKNVDRQKLWNDIEAAFNKLSPHWNQTTAAISFRYDFLTVLRVAKQYLKVLFQEPYGDEPDEILAANSSGIPCDPIDNDTIYPFIYLTDSSNNGAGDFIAKVTVTDEGKGITSVEWTLDFYWTYWKYGQYASGPVTNAQYTVTIPRADILKECGADTGYAWLRTTDSAGNAVVLKIKVKTVLGQNKYPSVSSAYIEDTDGDGMGDKVSVELKPDSDPAADQIKDWQKLEYSWPTQTSLKTADNSSVTLSGNTLTYSDKTLIGGAGTGLAQVTFKSGVASGPIADRVGPALVSAALNPKIVPAWPDTLTITVTEPLQENLANNTAYLNLYVSGSTTPSPITSLSATKIADATIWRLVFNANTVHKGDSVNFVYTGQTIVADTCSGHNPPLSINRKVVVTQKDTVDQGSKFPLYESAYIEDTKGDGNGDRITVTLKPGTSPVADQINQWKTAQYSWPDTTPLKSVSAPSSQVTVSGNSLIISDPSLQGCRGAGKAVVLFEKGSTAGKVDDRVGPVLRRAVLYEKKQPADPDSLLVTFAEGLKGNLAPPTAYVRIFAAPSFTVQTTPNSQSISSQNDSVWLFTYATNSVRGQDSANIVSTSGLVDLLNNAPHQNNRRVLITTKKEPLTLAASGSDYLDTNADGTMDKITVRFNQIITQARLSDLSFRFVWVKDGAGFDTVNLTASGPECVILGADNHIVCWSVPLKYSIRRLTTYFDLSKNSWGSAQLTQPDYTTGADIVSPIPMTDSMAPVIVRADYFAHGATNLTRDTLRVVFSEDAGKTGSDIPFKFLYTKGNTGYTLRMVNYDASANLLSFTITGSNGTYPSAGDSLWIHKDGAIKDKTPLQVQQSNDNNRKVLLNIVRVFSVRSAAYFDTEANPDGWIEEIRVVTDSVPGEAVIRKLASFIALPAAREFEVITGDSLSQSSNGFTIRVRQKNDVLDNRYYYLTATDVTSADVLGIGLDTAIQNNEVIAPVSVDIQDSLASVIRSAEYHYAYVTEENVSQNIPDTLYITYSEKVKPPALRNPFGFKPKAGAGYSMTLDQQTTDDNQRNAFIVKAKDQLPTNQDSIWVEKETGLQDILSRIQTKDTKPVPIRTSYHNYYAIKVFPNPLLRENEDQYLQLKNVCAKYLPGVTPEKDNMIILIIPYGYLGIEIKGTISIMDPLGNVVIRRKDLLNPAIRANGKLLYYLWDSSNDYAQRSVGFGMYKCLITINEAVNDAESTQKEFSIMLGVKKQQ